MPAAPAPSDVERAAVVAALRAAGPGAPTLCAGWRTEHLAAHLVLRERAPVAALGIALPLLAGRTERLVQGLGDRSRDPVAWEELLLRVAEGPPVWSPLRWGGAVAQVVEYHVHTEDVRRAGAGGAAVPPRRLTHEHEEALWTGLRRTAGLLLRTSPVPLELTDGAGHVLAAGGRTGGTAVVVTGPVGELLLWSYGRSRVARVELAGEPAAVAAARRLRPGPADG